MIEEGLESAEELAALSKLLGLPFAAITGVGESAGNLLKAASKQEKEGHRNDAAGSYLRAAVETRALILSGEETSSPEALQATLQLHNASLASFAEIWTSDSAREGSAPYHLDAGGEHFEIVLDSSSDYRAEYFDEAVAADSIRGKGVGEKKRAGYGAPMVGIRRQTPERADEMKHFPPQGLHLPVTLTITDVREAGSPEDLLKVVSLALVDPVQHQKVQVGSQSMPLAANFSAPILLMLDGKNEVIEGLFGFMNAKKRAEESGIYLLEPYDPDRIPVMLTHGLISVPIIWRDIIPELMSEPEISTRYQIFAFTYPSSYAIVESAELFREDLEALRQEYDPDGNDPLSTNMVAMGHSMGGILTHMMVTDFGDRIWNQVSDIPFDEFPLEPEARETLRSLTFFDYDKAVNRAVFISSPHRGADMATMSIAGAVSKLAKLPSNVVAGGTELFNGPPPEGLKIDIRKKVTSVQSLRPDSPILLAMDQSPYKPGVVYHTIVGDRGKGDTPDSSDGIVDYWSSHQEGAASELIVPTGHTSYEDPNAIEDLKRILRVHAGL
tara:strand:+ start:580 stop:2244 length:1665 start_codon:yes stop_codon:yes gene_type:complete